MARPSKQQQAQSFDIIEDSKTDGGITSITGGEDQVDIVVETDKAVVQQYNEFYEGIKDIKFTAQAKDVLDLAKCRNISNNDFLNAMLIHLGKNYGTQALDKIVAKYLEAYKNG